MKLKSSLSAVAAAGLLCTGVLLVEGCAKKVVASAPTKSEPVATRAPQIAKAPERPALSAPARPSQTAENSTPRVPDQATQARIQDLLNRIQDAYFDYNTANIRSDAQTALQADAKTLSDILRDYPTYKLTIEGYCDERGSEEYNIALGDARAKRAKEFLVDAGIPAQQLVTISYGKERPVCTESNESCWQKNRRIHITQVQS